MILVTGCAGYIGAICSLLLLEAGHEVIGVDNLSRGQSCNIPKGLKFYQSCVGDKSNIAKILEMHNVDAVLHFAAFIEVAESVKEPDLYKQNNYLNTINFIECLRDHAVNNFIFSSTAAVYGNPPATVTRLGEDLASEPINPYGFYKLEVEKYLATLVDFNYIVFRYFNVAGAYKDLGECHQPETHLIPLALDVALAKRDKFYLFGNDYPTPDSTAIRDYIHVQDLAQAHVNALMLLNDKSKSGQAYNLGYGHGFSVLEIVQAIERVSGLKIALEYAPRRAGDPAQLVADNTKALRAGLFKPANDSIDKIINDAFLHRLRYHESSFNTHRLP